MNCVECPLWMELSLGITILDMQASVLSVTFRPMMMLLVDVVGFAWSFHENINSEKK